MAHEMYISPKATFTSDVEIFLAGSLFAELADMVAGFASEVGNADKFNSERLTAVAYVSETLATVGNQLIEASGVEINGNG